MTLIQVALGGAIGASCRYLSGVAASRILGFGFPYGTLFVNVVGSFLMGVLVVTLAKKGGNHLAPFLMVGMLGGFTTFSSFSLDAVFLFERGEVGLAAFYVIVSVVVSIAALMAGLFLTRGIFA
mgnify:CR=1 FL=1